jgi:NAD(P)-dependent dehydrogenase (short-subunit alcohol dehydrogenase family)
MSVKYRDNNNNKKRVAVITGSGKGMGRAIAMEFAKAGYYVMINDLEQEEELKHTAEEISMITIIIIKLHILLEMFHKSKLLYL